MTTTLDAAPLLLEEVKTIPYEAPESSEGVFTHLVNPPSNTHIWLPGMSTQELVDMAREHSLEITALCGHTWVPKLNPDKYPVCQLCMDIAGDLMRGNGE